MRLGTSLLLIAAGAILRWAVTASTSGVNLHVVGLVLIIIGLVGFVISLFWMLHVAESDRRVDPPDNRPVDGYQPQARV